jgi:hypothetical protein
VSDQPTFSSRRDKPSERDADRRRKGGPSLPAGPEANELTSALMSLDQGRALALLTTATADGWDVKDVEEFIIEPAVTRLGELWTRGRLDDGTFRRAGTLAETVELAWRKHLVGAESRSTARVPRRTRG